MEIGKRRNEQINQLLLLHCVWCLTNANWDEQLAMSHWALTEWKSESNEID